MDLVDVMVVNVAVPSMRRGLGGSGDLVEWVVAGYAVAYGVVLIAGGRLGDVVGRKRAFLGGVVTFTLASAASGAAPSAGVLIAARVVQGLAAGVMTPQVLAVIQLGFPPVERPRAYALYGAAASLATVSGPLLGGLLVTADLLGLGWRAVFLINVPAGVVALVGVALLLDESRARVRSGFDLVGLGQLTLALLLLLFPLVEGRQMVWAPYVLLSLVASGPALALFGWHQHRRERAGAAPLVPLGLIRRRGMVVGTLAQLILFSGLTGIFLVLALTMQSGLGWSALASGLAFLPWSAGVALATGAAGRAAPGRRVTVAVIGAMAMAVGMVGVLAAVHLQGMALSPWALVPGLLVAGAGMGVVAPRLVDAALVGVRSGDAGAASGVVTTAGQLGSALGVALIGLAFFTVESAAGWLPALTAALALDTGVFALAALAMALLPGVDAARPE